MSETGRSCHEMIMCSVVACKLLVLTSKRLVSSSASRIMSMTILWHDVPVSATYDHERAGNYSSSFLLCNAWGMALAARSR